MSWIKTFLRDINQVLWKSRKLFVGQNKNTSRASNKARVWFENENPTPLQFDKFIPWLCLQMRVTTLVTVERMTKGHDTSHESVEKKVSSIRSRSKESTLLSEYLDITKLKDINSFSSSSISSHSGDVVNILSYYNQRNELVEIAIKDCRVGINRKVIQAINICLPFHEFLKKFVINGEGLTKAALYEIGNLLPHSNITDVCLDGTYLPEGNYYVLLNKINQLQNLSLCKCKINDEVCKTLAANLNFETPASKTLLTMDLTSNCITDLGASYLGVMLRKNRSLLYLNLSDNIIGDTGATNILRSLMLFTLADDERYELKKRRFKYAAIKLEEYKKCEKEIRDRMKSENNKENVQPQPEKRKTSKYIKTVKVPVSFPVNVPTFDEITLKAEAEKMTIQNIGVFSDIFDDENVTFKNGKLQCIGNFKFCYLNLAYNNIKYRSLKKLCEVLKHQSSVSKPPCNGLLKVVIDGNNLPVADELLETIQSYLQIAIQRCSQLRDTSISLLGKKSRRKLHTH